MQSNKNNQIKKPIHCPACSKVLIKINKHFFNTELIVKCGNCGKQSIITVRNKKEIEVTLDKTK